MTIESFFVEVIVPAFLVPLSAAVADNSIEVQCIEGIEVPTGTRGAEHRAAF